MIFGTSNYWATDSMQWNNQPRAIESKWDAAPVAEPAEHTTILFAAPGLTMQAQLDRERAQ